MKLRSRRTLWSGFVPPLHCLLWHGDTGYGGFRRPLCLGVVSQSRAPHCRLGGPSTRGTTAPRYPSVEPARSRRGTVPGRPPLDSPPSSSHPEFGWTRFSPVGRGYPPRVSVSRTRSWCPGRVGFSPPRGPETPPPRSSWSVSKPKAVPGHGRGFWGEYQGRTGSDLDRGTHCR